VATGFEKARNPEIVLRDVCIIRFTYVRPAAARNTAFRKKGRPGGGTRACDGSVDHAMKPSPSPSGARES